VPRQNRVTPLGEIVAVPDRGTLLGNRGCLRDAKGQIRRPWQLERWIVCVLAFKGRKRRAMTPGTTRNCSSSSNVKTFDDPKTAWATLMSATTTASRSW
jgi:hypothetical protein